MLNREKHQLIMGQILKDICQDRIISSVLGFKGGTCAYLFYDLPRFSVDLDFDLFTTDKKTIKYLFCNIEKILKKYGKIIDQQIKYNTILLHLSYGLADQNIKIEINIRNPLNNLRGYYELKEYLGIPIMVAKKEYLFSSKLVALTQRKTLAIRDVYDIYFFIKNNWEIDPEIIQFRTKKTLKKYLSDCIAKIEKIKNSQLLSGIGELITNKEKIWVKNKLKPEVIFLLKNYQSILQ